MVEQKKIKLNFPLNNGGQEVGISEGALEHFTGKLVESLCKEILQNSLDARVEKNQVTVKFELLEMLAKDIPEIEGLRKSINKCIEYWSDNEKASKILKKALKSLEGEVIKVLRVSDYGTCGLTGVKEKRNSNFFNLVKSSGASSKGGQSGGSFGIGKFAPFACSFPRTVFYSTLNTNNEYAFQGVSRLVTHRINEETTQGVGYIGNSNGNKPIVDKLDIPSAFLREEIGTDLNILGFNESKNWKESIIKSSLMSFFESIYEGKLKIIVENEIVDASNLKEFGLKYLEKNKEKNYTYEYFKCLLEKESDEKRVIKENFVFKGENFGEVELHLLKERGFRKRIAFLRSTGMKIIDKGNFRTAMQFSGILKLKGNKINSFIRGLETPSHDKLEKDRHDNPKYAEHVLKALYSFIKDKVIDFGKLNEGEELDLKGLSKYLPDNSKENELLNYIKKKLFI